MKRSFGQIAFDAYNEAKGGKTWDGRDIPTWEEVGDDVRNAWGAAATAVVQAHQASVNPPVEEGRAAPKVQQPSLGRIVHYVDGGGEERAAIIVQLFDRDMVGLVLFTPGDVPAHYDAPVEFDADRFVGTWHWPEFVPAK